MSVSECVCVCVCVCVCMRVRARAYNCVSRSSPVMLLAFGWEVQRARN